MRRAIKGMLIVGFALVAAATLLQAQAARPESTDMALLAEVKALRAEINDAASGSMRMQLLIARLSLQEQRITALSRQLTDVQRDFFEAAQATSALQSHLKGIEESLLTPRIQGGPDRDELESMRNGARRDLLAKQQRQEQLRLQTDDLQNAVAAEQGRWTEFNSRIDELDRSLPPVRR
jgi:uncharacterized coiled-coil protein SlyX